jgi:hypothetical protein
MPHLSGGGEDNSKRREVSFRGERGASADGDNERRAYLRRDVVDSSGRRWHSVGCGGGGHSGDGGQRLYLKRPCEVGDTGWCRWLVLCKDGGMLQGGGGGGGSAERVGDGVPGTRATNGGSSDGTLSCNGESSGGMEQLNGPGAMGPEARTGSGWLKVKEAGMDDVGEQATEARTALTFTNCAEKFWVSVGRSFPLDCARPTNELFPLFVGPSIVIFQRRVAA